MMSSLGGKYSAFVLATFFITYTYYECQHMLEIVQRYNISLYIATKLEENKKQKKEVQLS